MSAALRAIAILAVCAVSMVLFAWQVSSDSIADFANGNLLSQAPRARLLFSMLAGGLGVAFVSFCYFRVAGGSGERRLDVFSRIAFPLAMAGLVPPLFLRGLWDPLSVALAIAAFTLLAEQLFRQSLGGMNLLVGASDAQPSLSRGRSTLATATVIACCAAYALYMGVFTIFNHRRFGTYGFDLGQYDNIFWNALHGFPMRCTPLGGMTNWSELGNHAELSVYFLLPFYALRPNAETLLVLQACILGLGAIPVYLFAARRLSPVHACILAICYLFYPPLHGANFYDFHFQPVAATFVLFTIYFIDTRRWILGALTFVIALGCREDISVGLTVLGIYYLLTGYRPKAGSIMAVVAAAYFVAMRFVIMPRFGQSWFSDIYKDLYPQPDGAHSFGGVMVTMATNPVYVFRTLLTPDKLRYFLQIAAP
ncbi:MAG TPA: DUF2079 domain-containing protein, partial [Polyangiaceae bacterium]|nr:DUF2079 domain-containing protein [Polyangiaceae bacterium]